MEALAAAVSWYEQTAMLFHAVEYNTHACIVWLKQRSPELVTHHYGIDSTIQGCARSGVV